MRRLVRYIVIALLGVPAATRAQDATGVLEDANLVRGALGDVVHANVRIEAGALAAAARLRIGQDAIVVSFADGSEREIAADDLSASVEWRLIAAALARGPLVAQLDSFGVLDTSRHTILVDGSPDSRTGFAVRVGTDVPGVTLEVGTGRLRQIRAVADGVRWRLDASTDDERANGWFFSRLEVYRDGVLAVRVTFVDVAARADDLAPLEPTAAAEPPPAPATAPAEFRLPWLPL